LSRSTPATQTEQVEDSLGYTFRKRELLSEALIHKSYYHENRDKVSVHNERLEFLGDSVLGLVVVEHLYRQNQSYSEAVLAKIKSFIVSEPVLADVAFELSLGKYLMLGKGERSTGGAAKRSILADAFEAVIGAVYLDAGFNKAREIILGLFSSRIAKAIEGGDFFDYKTELQEKSQALFGKLPLYKVVRQEGDEHERIFTVEVYLNNRRLGIASGRRKKEAESLAAKEALNVLSVSAEIGEVDMDPEVLAP